MKTEVLEYVKNQIGIELELCDHFTEIKNYNGKPYFNVIVENAVCNSRQYTMLERLANNSSVIAEVQPNGVDRVAIICYPQ